MNESEADQLEVLSKQQVSTVGGGETSGQTSGPLDVADGTTVTEPRSTGPGLMVRPDGKLGLTYPKLPIVIGLDGRIGITIY